MTESFEWDEAFAVDHGEIDREHRRLFELANEVLSIDDPVRESARLCAAVKALYQYMASHFESEEQLMRRVGFAYLEAHVESHKRIMRKMNGLLTSQSDLADFASRLKAAMSDWVVKHIDEEDKQLAAYIPPVMSFRS